MSVLQKSALVLTIIGAINWGLIGLFEYDLVVALFGGLDSMVTRTIYTLIGLAGLINIGIFFELMDDHK
jgi:uncharacterized membrane protein YuzA (DUF378 family)